MCIISTVQMDSVCLNQANMERAVLVVYSPFHVDMITPKYSKITAIWSGLYLNTVLWSDAQIRQALYMYTAESHILHMLLLN